MLRADAPTISRNELGERDTMCTGTHDFIPAENTARVRLIYSTHGGEAMNVFYFQNSGGWDAASLFELTNEVIGSWEDNLAPVTSDNIVLTTVEAVAVDAEEGESSVQGPNTPGTNTNNSAPDNVTFAAAFKSGFVGRSRRGRMYFVGLPITNLDGDKLQTGAPGNYATAIEEFFGQIATDMPTVQHVIVSYCSNGDWRTDALVTPVTSYTVEENLDSQRRRLIGRGV